MIVREYPTAYVMIEQAEHAYMSGQMISQWKDSLFIGETYRPSIEYAIAKHDDGNEWKIDERIRGLFFVIPKWLLIDCFP
ncbi:MAG TPA: DUF3891 family protein [Bacillota bacterium]